MLPQVAETLGNHLSLTLCFWFRVSSWSPGWPPVCNPPHTTSDVLRLHICTTCSVPLLLPNTSLNNQDEYNKAYEINLENEAFENSGTGQVVIILLRRASDMLPLSPYGCQTVDFHCYCDIFILMASILKVKLLFLTVKKKNSENEELWLIWLKILKKKESGPVKWILRWRWLLPSMKTWVQ